MAGATALDERTAQPILEAGYPRIGTLPCYHGLSHRGLMAEAPRERWARGPFRCLGPALITGAADNDPDGIAAQYQADAQFGVNMLWTVVLALPLMTAVHSICARIGQVTGEGLAVHMAKVLPCWLMNLLVLLLSVVNAANIGADLAAMGAAAQLVLGWGEKPFTLSRLGLRIVGFCAGKSADRRLVGRIISRNRAAQTPRGQGYGVGNLQAYSPKKA